MGSGKSFTGKRLAGRLKYDFTDIDKLFEDRYHFTISDFFERFGEDAFRKLESDLLKTTAALENTVISTGGGTACFFDNMEFMNRHGITVYLKMPAKMILSRLNQSKKPRPLIKALKGEELLAKIEEMLEQREKFYLLAQHIVKIPGQDLEEIIQAILKGLPLGT